MGAILFEGVFVPVFIFLGILAARRYRAKQKRRIEEYRTSPKSRLLHLNN